MSDTNAGRVTKYDAIDLHIKTCTGDQHKLVYDESTHTRVNRGEANKAIFALDRVGQQGKDFSFYRGRDPLNWFITFPGQAHLASLTVYSRNPVSDEATMIDRYEYRCEHARPELVSVSNR